MNKHNFLNISERQYLWLLFAPIIIFNLVLAKFGLQLGDDGWVLSAYQQTFSAPEYATYNFLYYTSCLLGGIWEIMFGQFGIYGYKVFTIILTIISIAILFALLKGKINRWAFLSGVWLVLLCKSLVTCAHHNVFSSVCMLVVALLLYKGLQKESSRFCLFAGLVLGMSIFLRLPNVAMCGMVLVFIPYYILNTSARKGMQTLQLLAVSLLGTIIGVLTIVLIMLMLGHWGTFIEAIAMGFNVSDGESENAHSVTQLLATYINDYLLVVKGMFGFALALSMPIVQRLTEKCSKYIRYVVFLVLSLVAMFCYKVDNSHAIFDIYAIITMGMAYLLWQNKADKDYVCLIVICLLFMYLLPLGGDCGLLNMNFCSSIIGGPFAFEALRQFWRNNRGQKVCNLSIVLCVIGIAVIVYKEYRFIAYSGYSGVRIMDRHYSADVPNFNVLMTIDESRELESIVTALDGYVKPGDELLVYDNMPILNYVTKTKPYLRNSWVWVYSTSIMKNEFDNAQRYKPLPVVVRQKTLSTSLTFMDKDWDSTEATETRSHQNGKVQLMNDFIKHNNYQVVWEDNCFQILTTSQVNN